MEMDGIWPSEEILAYYCTKNKSLVEGKKVCELGGGMTSLAGIQIGVACDIQELLLTDGNQYSVENMKEIITENSSSLRCKSTSCQKLVWSENIDELDDKYMKYFDVLICADALFFVNCHQALLFTINYMLKHDGICIMTAPRRSNTLEDFVQKARKTFHVEVIEHYDDVVWDLHEQYLKRNSLYEPDLHYPILLKLIKK